MRRLRNPRIQNVAATRIATHRTWELIDQRLSQSPAQRMQRLVLRDHPQLNFLGRSSWPPIWVHTRTTPYKKLTGEVGTFIGSICYEYATTRLFLKMAFERQPYLGCLVVQDAIFCHQLHDFLRKHIGLSIKGIGDLDLSQTLWPD